MSDFSKFKISFTNHVNSMLDNQDVLFLTDVEKDTIWNTYLESFPEGTNLIYKKKREFDCNGCKQFIRPYGNMVVIKDNKLVSIWDGEYASPFQEVAKKLSKLVKSKPIKNIFVTKEKKLGISSNKQRLEDGTIITWEHLFYELPKKFVTNSSDSIEAIQGSFRDTKNVFKRSMKELTLEAGNTLLELINQGSIYRGEEFVRSIKAFIKFKTFYDDLPSKELKDNWCWLNSINNPVGKIRNTAIGTLLIDMSNEVDLDLAVTKFEKIMAPTNYKRPKAIISKKMIEGAEKTIVELGLSESLGRKHALLEDITVNNVIFVDRDAEKKLGGSVFDELKEEVPENIKTFNKIEEVGIEDFIENILPEVSSIEMLIENKHQGNLMSLVAPKDTKAESILLWNNNFSWSYNGDVADSMKQRVKNAGGNVEGVLRFSIQWNDGDNNQNDFDAHCIEPTGNEIEYGSKGRIHRSSGMLDVDIINPRNEVAVENITWSDESKMPEGRYIFFVKNYSHNGGRTGFTAEIEYDGQIYSYSYDKELRQKENVVVAKIEYSRANGIKFIKSLDSTQSSKEIWGLNTNKFSKVSVLMYSPNFWDGQKGIGNKHYFFFMDNCKTETAPRGFYNEFLKTDLIKHKRVFEALGSKMRVESSDSQLSGLGFSSTQNNSIVVKVKGSFSRVIKIKF